MNVKSAIKAVMDFVNLPSAFGPINVEVSEAWHFNASFGTKPYLQGESGIYLLTEPRQDGWKQPAETNEQEIWYVGKSNDVGGRVWEHFGRVYEPGTSNRCFPRFKYHRWAGLSCVPINVQQSCAEGDVVVYTVAIHNSGQGASWILPELLEKYVLVKLVLENGRLPYLNLQM